MVDGIDDRPSRALQTQNPMSMVVALELVPHGENRHLALLLDLEEGNVARSSERNVQFSEEQALSSLAACERRRLQRGDA